MLWEFVYASSTTLTVGIYYSSCTVQSLIDAVFTVLYVQVTAKFCRHHVLNEIHCILVTFCENLIAMMPLQ